MDEIRNIKKLDFGNNIRITGLVMSHKDGKVFNILTPSNTIADLDYSSLEILDLNGEEWSELIRQLDILETEGIRGDEKVILRKSQQIVDNNVYWTVFRRDNYSCRYCAKNDVPLTYDHVVTWEKGGPTTVENGVTACRKCNKKRGNLDFGSWLEHSYYIERSKYLSERVLKMNQDLVLQIPSIQTVQNIRSR